MTKLHIALIFGGQSGEHEVSLQSAKSIYEAIDKEKYDVSLIGIDKSGQWLLGKSANFLLNASDPKLIKLNTAELNAVTPRTTNNEIELYSSLDNTPSQKIDVFFNIIHGSTGEDGAIQGLFEMLGAAYVGAGVLGSAVGMDKEMMKRILWSAQLPIAQFTVVKRHELDDLEWGDLLHGRNLPFFIKPANAGSSVGVSKAKTLQEVKDAVINALQYDNKVIIEEYIKGREIECSVLGNTDPIASVCGEITPQHEFYSYEAKYIDEKGAILKIPAELSNDTQKKIQDYALKVFQILECRGLARVDFFLTEQNEIYINEINTLPGFTKVSMYPKLWEATGIPYSELIDRLIAFAIEEKESKKKLKRTFEI